MKITLHIALAAVLVTQAQAQMPIGSVASADADVSPTPQIAAGKALLPATSTITAHDHTAEVSLERHGLVMVCATTALHVTDSQQADGPLMLSMDRGALELRITAHTGDVLLTPDLRIEADDTGSLSLALRVARNGDTCVDNRDTGNNAPTLHIHSQFGDGEYLVRPGQHVLFNGGNLHEVVDNETTPCGCPQNAAGLIADAAQSPAAAANAKKFPFPLAQSEGLAPTPAPKPTAPGETQVTINANMSYDGSHPTTPVAPPPLPPQKRSFFAGVSHFFKHLFGKE